MKELFFRNIDFFIDFQLPINFDFSFEISNEKKNRILNFHSRFEFPAMLVVCGWSIWTPPVIRVDTHTRIAVLCLPFPNLRWVSFELIWGVIWAHMRCHLSSYETSFELIWAHLISNSLIWYQITSNDTSHEISYEMSNEIKRGSAGVSKN